jgi:hypothetical protein
MQKQEQELLALAEKQSMMNEDYRLLMQKQEQELLALAEKLHVRVTKINILKEQKYFQQIFVLKPYFA